jgi:pyrroloquinoline quinone biosynthesis protein B
MAWSRDARVSPRTQSSLAVTTDGDNWVLLNASPDIRQQIAATSALHPRDRGPVRDSPIKAVVLSSAEIDSIAGLLSLRERQPLALYASTAVLETIAANRIFDALSPACVVRVPLEIGRSVLLQSHGLRLGLRLELLHAPGKVPLYLEGDMNVTTSEEDCVGVRISEDGTGKEFFFIPGCAALDETLRERLRGAELLFFDGTLYRDDELVQQGLSEKTGRRMGHMSMSGVDGSMAAFADLAVKRRIFVHINTSNPVLIDGSAEHLAVVRAGWEIAYDGMEIRL